MSTHVVVGAGATGTATALNYAKQGQHVRVLTRSGSGPDHPLIERVAADASDPDALTKLVDGATTLTNCAMPAYHRWPEEFPALHRALLRAAEGTGAGFVMLGNTYAYAPTDGPVTDDLPIALATRKGRVRAKMWLDALAAHEAGRVKVTEVRAGEFLGPGAGSLFSLLAQQGVLKGDPALLPADLDQPHSYSYIGDVATTLVAVGTGEQAWVAPGTSRPRSSPRASSPPSWPSSPVLPNPSSNG